MYTFCTQGFLEEDLIQNKQEERNLTLKIHFFKPYLTCQKHLNAQPVIHHLKRLLYSIWPNKLLHVQ